MNEINENPSELNGSQVQNQQISDYLTKSIKELMSLAKDDDPEAMFELGHRYRIGDGCKIDMGISDDWFEKAVECGYDYKSYYSKGLPEERYDSLLRLIKNYEDDCYWGIQEFEDPQDAWKVMNGSWISDESGVDINLCVLDDEEFENMIFCRAVVALCEEHFGKITHEECMLRLGKNGISDYL